MSHGPKANIIDHIEEHTKACSFGICHEHTYYLIHVQKAKEESVVQVQNPNYSIELDRTDGGRLGFKLDIHSSTKSLYIKEIVGALAAAWNKSNPDSKVRPGDRIIKVNDVEGDVHLLMEECKKNAVLHLEIFRQTAVPITAGLQVTVKHEITHLHVGLDGMVVKVDEEGDAFIKFSNERSQWVCKEDYSKFTFQETERFYLKRFCDFKDLLSGLKNRFDSDPDALVQNLPSMPVEERFGFRRQFSALTGVGSFMQMRKDGLQKALDLVLGQIPKLQAEPVIGDFFGPDPLPDVTSPTKDILRQRMNILLVKHRKRPEIVKEVAEEDEKAA